MNLIIKKIHIKNFRSIDNIDFETYENNLILGANNSGKTTIIDALRWFFSKEYKFNPERDLPLNNNNAQPFVEITFSKKIKISLTYSNGKEIYKLSGGKKKQYTTIDSILNELKINLNVLYIPSVTNVNDYIKLSGQSPLRKILLDILTQCGQKEYKKEWESLVQATNIIKGSQSIITDLNDELKDWDVSLSINSPTPNIESLIKNFVNVKISHNAQDYFDIENVGSGLQRQLIFKLLKAINKQSNPNNVPKTVKQCNILLFEEPEAFLHFDQQQELARTLKGLSSTNQVFVTTHSHAFLSRNIADLKTIIRVYKEGATTKVVCISNSEAIYNRNIDEINNFIGAPNSNEECYRYFNYLDGIRGAMFFAEKVLLVEGQTEVIFINKLVDDGKINLLRGLYVVETLGKFNMPRFMNLLYAFKIPYAVLHDLDTSENQGRWNALIKKVGTKHKSKVFRYENAIDLERFIGIDVPNRKDLKPLSILYKYEKGIITTENLNKFIKLINTIFDYLNNKEKSPN